MTQTTYTPPAVGKHVLEGKLDVARKEIATLVKENQEISNTNERLQAANLDLLERCAKQRELLNSCHSWLLKIAFNKPVSLVDTESLCKQVEQVLGGQS